MGRLLERIAAGGGRRRQPRDTDAPWLRHALLADGRRIDLTVRGSARLRADTTQDWQADAFGYAKLLPEIGYVNRFRANAVARCRFYPALLPADPSSTDDPVPLADTEDAPADFTTIVLDNWDRLPIDNAPTGLVARAARNLDLVGEVYVHGYVDDGDERWESLSVTEVTAQGDDVWKIKRTPRDMTGIEIRPQSGDAHELLRIWMPSPEWRELAESAMLALSDTCEDVVLTQREMRAAARSRLAANGLLLLPRALMLARSADPNAENEPSVLSVAASNFLADFTAAVMAPVNREGEAAEAAPMVIVGEAGDLKEVRHLRFDRATDEHLVARSEAALRRIATGMDAPREIQEGLGAVNHWSAWQISQAVVTDSIEPLAGTLAGGLLQSYLRPVVRAMRPSTEPALLRRLVIAVDASPLLDNPNRSADADAAHDRITISDAAYRVAKGFEEGDAPDAEEYARRVAVKTGVDQGSALQILAAVFGRGPGALFPVLDGEVVPDDAGQPALPGPASQDPGSTAPGQGVPARPTPDPADAPITAAVSAAMAADQAGWIVDVALARRLSDIDARLRDQLQAGAEMALERALELTANRIRSAAQRDRVLAATLRGLPHRQVPGTVGRDAVLRLGLADMDILRAALTTYREQATAWIAAAVQATADVVARLLRLPARDPARDTLTARLRAALDERTTTALDVLIGRLTDLASDLLYDPTPRGGDLDGEQVTGHVPPGLVRAALAAAGADGPLPADQPAGGLATGPIVIRELERGGAVRLGYEWRYGVSLRQFRAHRALDAVRFAGWTSPVLEVSGRDAWLGVTHYRPGDHDGCLCDYTLIVAAPPPGSDYGRLLGVDTASMADVRVLAEMDDRAGRSGTEAQRTRDVREQVLALQARHVTDYRGGQDA